MPYEVSSVSLQSPCSTFWALISNWEASLCEIHHLMMSSGVQPKGITTRRAEGKGERDLRLYRAPQTCILTPGAPRAAVSLNQGHCSSQSITAPPPGTQVSMPSSLSLWVGIVTALLLMALKILSVHHHRCFINLFNPPQVLHFAGSICFLVSPCLIQLPIERACPKYFFTSFVRHMA